MTIIEKKERQIDVSDPKWAHPEVAFTWLPAFEEDPYSFYEDENLSYEEKHAVADKLAAAWSSTVEPLPEDAFCTVEEYEAPGCPKEPDTSVKVFVYTPKNLTATKTRTLFNIPGGGLYQVVRNDLEACSFSEHLNCIIVFPVYRTSLEGAYPAAINDCHAAYQWMVDNAEKLHVDPDCVVLTGMSSGGHLATAMPFRLMKYGYSPRGVVPRLPMTDDRGFTRSARLFPGMQNFAESNKACRRWLRDSLALSVLGPEAFANRATVEECVGYPPLFLHAAEHDTDRDNSLQFVSKVLEAQSLAEMHL
jgi:acetyl esterase/lipase